MIGPIIVARFLEIFKYGNIVLYPLKTIKKVRKEKQNEEEKNFIHI